MSQVLISLTAPLAIEETMVDWLLEHPSTQGFSSYPISGHSSKTEGLTLAEQVAGRKKQIRFQLHLPQAELAGFLARFKQDFKGTGVHYWVTALLDEGHV